MRCLGTPLCGYHPSPHPRFLQKYNDISAGNINVVVPGTLALLQSPETVDRSDSIADVPEAHPRPPSIPTSWSQLCTRMQVAMSLVELGVTKLLRMSKPTYQPEQLEAFGVKACSAAAINK